MTRARDVADTQDNVGGAVPPSVAGKNKIINGSMAVAQRGTTFTSVASTYTLDRWLVDPSGTVSRDTGTDGISHSIKVSNTSTNPAIRQGIELPATGNAGQFTVGSTWTISFYAKRSTGTGAASIYAAFNNGLFGSATQVLLNLNIGTVTTSWQRFSLTFTISVSPGGSDNCLVIVPFTNVGAFAGDTWFTGVQLEQGSVATTPEYE